MGNSEQFGACSVNFHDSKRITTTYGSNWDMAVASDLLKPVRCSAELAEISVSTLREFCSLHQNKRKYARSLHFRLPRRRSVAFDERLYCGPRAITDSGYVMGTSQGRCSKGI
jgi:hypothetical protein